MSDSQMTSIDDETPVEKSSRPSKVDKAKQTAAANEAGLTGARKIITIHQGEGAAGREDVDIFVNGFGFKIKRGKPVDVPVEVVEVLKNAVTTTYENGESIEVPRFAYSVHN